MVNDGMGLVPLWNFAKLREHVYRAGQPPALPFVFPWLQEQGFGLVVNCTHKGQGDAKMNSVSINEWVAGLPDDQAPTMEMLFNAVNATKQAIQEGKRVLVHCTHGHGRTSTFACALRIALDGITAKQAIEEEETIFGYTFRIPEQKKAVFNFEYAWRMGERASA